MYILIHTYAVFAVFMTIIFCEMSLMAPAQSVFLLLIHSFDLSDKMFEEVTSNYCSAGVAVAL